MLVFKNTGKKSWNKIHIWKSYNYYSEYFLLIGEYKLISRCENYGTTHCLKNLTSVSYCNFKS